MTESRTEKSNSGPPFLEFGFRPPLSEISGSAPEHTTSTFVDQTRIQLTTNAEKTGVFSKLVLQCLKSWAAMLVYQTIEGG